MNNWTPEQYQLMAMQNQMTSGDSTMGGSGGGSEQNWNQSQQGGFIGPIPPENQDTMDLTQDEGNDQPMNGDKTGSNNLGRGRNSDSHNNRDTRWNRNRDRDNRDSSRSHGDRNDRGSRNDRDDHRDRSRSNRGRERTSRFSNRDKPLLPGMPGNPSGLTGPGMAGMGAAGMGGPGGPDNSMMMPGMMPPYGNNMASQPPMDMMNPNMMAPMNVHPNMMGNMMMPGQMPGPMQVMMHGQMPGQMHGQMPGQMHGQMPGQMSGQMPGMMDSNMMVAQQMQMLASAQPIYIQAGVLLPPIPGTALPPRRERPVGCRTIFVGGLPPGIGMDTIREIFQRFGSIDDVKIHKQGVCHIRFAKREIVEMSFFITGYRFKSHDQSEKEATTLFIDYALNREDQSEGERQKREPTPPRIEPFTPAALTEIVDKIKSDTDFAESAPTLVGWLEKGECNKKNANVFYSLIQASNNQVRRLYNDKMAVDEEYLTFKTNMKDKFAHIIFQFEQVAKILSAAKHKKASDHFTKQQRRNVEMWLKMTEDLANIKEEFNILFDDDEHERIGQKVVPADKYEQLKTENDTLIVELEGYKNEAHLAKDEAARMFEKFKAQFIAQQALQGGRMSQQQQPGIFPPLPPPPPMPGMEHTFQPPTPSYQAQPPTPSYQAQPPTPSYQPQPPTPDEMNQRQTGSPNDAKLVATLTAFLLAHPLGATLDYLSSYIRSMFPGVTHQNVNSVLLRNGEVFARQGSDRWTFVLFDIVKKEH